MKILIVEDDENKLRQILSFLSSRFPRDEFSCFRSYTSGLKAIRSEAPDLVLLDMSLPNFDGEISTTDGGKFRSYGGRDILHQLARRKSSAKVLIVTQYDTFSAETNAKSLEVLSSELLEEFPKNFLGTVYYSSSQEDWKSRLSETIERESDR